MINGRESADAIDPRRLAAFEDRYGAGSYERLLLQLRQPCVTFAEIASQYGVTRERVRQWHLGLLPGAPSGHQRQRLCGIYRQKRRLLEDPLFRSFYRHARAHFPAGAIALLPATDGFRKRAVRIGEYVVALKDAGRHAVSESRAERAFVLSPCRTGADFVYYRLAPADYLFVPRSLVPPAGTTFSDVPVSRYRPYKNSFAPLRATPAAASERPPERASRSYSGRVGNAS